MSNMVSLLEPPEPLITEPRCFHPLIYRQSLPELLCLLVEQIVRYRDIDFVSKKSLMQGFVKLWPLR